MKKVFFSIPTSLKVENNWHMDKDTEFWIYGYGRIGKETIDTLLEQKRKIRGIIDKNPVADCNKGITVIEADKWEDYDSGLVLICTDIYYEDIKKELLKRNIKSFAPYYSIYLGRELKFTEYNKVNRVMSQIEYYQYKKTFGNEKVVLDGLDIVITEKCSLKCKECSNLMQYFSCPQNADFNELMNSLEKILKSVIYIKDINILGGEPFMNKEWCKYVLEVVKYRNIGNILVHTNATILPLENDLKKINDKRVIFKISNYGKESLKVNEIIDQMEKFEICYTVTEMKKWIRCGDIYQHHRSEDENVQIYNSCCMKGTLSLKDGNIFGCPFASSVAALQAVPSEINEGVSIEAADKDNIVNGIKEIQKKSYLKVCDYCEGRPIGMLNIPAAEQINEPRYYKKYDYSNC